eukprot:1158020-Pelagomonas_calceolata.AAC.5
MPTALHYFQSSAENEEPHNGRLICKHVLIDGCIYRTRALPLHCPQSLFGTLTPDVAILTILYSIAGLGIAIVNDFKSIEGDRWASGM